MRSTRPAEVPGEEADLCGLIEPLLRNPVPGKQFVEPALRRPGDTAKHVGQPGLGIDIVGEHRNHPANAAPKGPLRLPADQQQRVGQPHQRRRFPPLALVADLADCFEFGKRLA